MLRGKARPESGKSVDVVTVADSDSLGCAAEMEKPAGVGCVVSKGGPGRGTAADEALTRGAHTRFEQQHGQIYYQNASFNVLASTFLHTSKPSAGCYPGMLTYLTHSRASLPSH